jgi:preprotein translocase subunit YajC
MPTWPELATWILLAQDAQDGAGDDGGQGGGFLQMILGNPLLLMLLLFAVFYLVLIRPRQRERAQMKQLLSNLQKNDRVITIGGIHGTVVNTSKDSNMVTLRIDDSNNTRIRVLRSAIDRIDTGDQTDEKDDKPKKDSG